MFMGIILLLGFVGTYGDDNKIRHTAAVRAAIHTLKVQVVIHQALHQARQHLPAVNLEVHQERLAAQANQAVQ